jgi:glycosyltransferase involved in cell wall biosynthesis
MHAAVTTRANVGPPPGAGVKPRYRILLAIEAAGGGAGRHVIDLAAGLIRRNHNVCLVYSPDRAEAKFQQALDSLPDVSVHELPMRRSVGWHDLRHVRQLRDLIRRLGPFDVLHGHSSKAGALLRLAARGSGAPCIYTPHAFITLDPEIGRLPGLAYGSIERALAPLAHRIVCVSTTEYRHARKLGIPDHRLAVVPNGITTLPPANGLAIRSELGIPSDALVIGGVGRLTHQKAMERLLSAFALGAATLPGTWLVIAGDGPAMRALREQAETLGVSDRVLLPGHVDGARVIAAFDIFALPSRYEAFPYVLLEATARALPVVMTETGGAGDIVRNELNGYVTPQGNMEAFSARVLQLAGDPELRLRFGQQGLHMSRNFTAERMVLKTLAVYGACIAEQS